MQRVFSIEDIPRDLPWPVATLGTFDGVHLGHQKVLNDTVAWAREHDGAATVVTFSQPPRSVTTGAAAPCITSTRHRLALLERQGIDVAIVIEFTPELAAIPAEEFARKVFCEAIGARGIQWGFNCRFGHKAQGGVELLRQFEQECHFEVRQSGPVDLDGQPVSSTAIRKAILEGRLDDAARMLGRRVSLLGTVVHGDHRGTSLGFPTANLDLHHEAVPPPGIYACRALVRGQEYVAVANVGPCPSFDPPKPPDAVEVFILDFAGELHGEDIEVQFFQYLRDEKKFDNVDDLITQMHRDVVRTRELMAGG